VRTGNSAGTGELFVNGKSVGKVDMWIFPPGDTYPIPGWLPPPGVLPPFRTVE
jgi:hypothetical protein